MTAKKKILILGGTGYAGSAIAREAVHRNHSVTAVSRSAPADPISGVDYVRADALQADLDLGGSDVVIGALSPRAENAGTLLQSYRRLMRQAHDAGARLVLVGGFSCLRREAGAPRMIEGEAFPPGVPEDVVIEARENMDVLNALLADDTNLDWLFVSPAMEFSAWMPGEDLGHYRVGGEIALFDETGRSAISGPDFARAVLDEIETPRHRRAQIGVAY